MASHTTRHNYLIVPEVDSSRLEVLFAEIARALAEDNLPAALRLADSVCRVAPDDATCVLLYARLLINAGFAAEAERRLRGRPESSLIVARGVALCELGLFDEAVDLCATLLARFALNAVEGLQALASRLTCELPSTRAAGWVGVDTSLRLTGEITSDCVLRITQFVSERSLLESFTRDIIPEEISQHLLPLDRGRLRSFVAEMPTGFFGRLSVSAEGSKLLGSEIVWPPVFAVAGWVTAEHRTLQGRVRMDWAPNLPIPLSISSPGGNIRHLVTPSADGATGMSFSVELDVGETELLPIEVSAVLPDGTHLPLTGSPIEMQLGSPLVADVSQKLSASNPNSNLSAPGFERTVNIVIPVYAGFEETLKCLKSVLATTTRAAAEVVVVDDASPDSELRGALIRLSEEGQITLLTNAYNLGFPSAANRGIAQHAGRDIILLNSDTEVFGDWLERLTSAAYSSVDIGTATPLGEAASIVSYPSGESANCTAEEAAEIDCIARAVNARKVVEILVGVGFCLYVKRACLATTGNFRDELFGKGYGEENDFCLRSASLGWRHVAATDVFVRHRGARSFGSRKSMLMERNACVLRAIYPDYDCAVATFIAADPLLDARRTIDEHRLLRVSMRTVLLITSDLSGGVKRHIDSRRSHLTATGQSVVVLQPSGKSGDRISLSVANGSLKDLTYHLPKDSLPLSRLLLKLRLENIELHHCLGISSAVLELLLGLDVRYDVYIHDYSWICPRMSLTQGDGSYCGEPAVEHCEICVRQHGGYFDELLTVQALRSRSAKIIDGANRVIVPTNDVRIRLDRYFPGRPMEVMAWEDVNWKESTKVPLRARAGRVRAAVIGAISVPKGYNVLLKCAEDAAARDLDLEFTVIGYTSNDGALLATGRVFITGKYTDDEIETLLAREDCDIALFPSVVPETWCYALSHALVARLPIVAFELGAIAERLQQYPAACLLPLSSPPAAMNDTLLRSAQKFSTIRTGRVRPMETISSLNPNSVAVKAQASDGFATSVQTLPLPEGIYTFTAKGGAPSAASLGDDLVLPAVQVGVAPTKFEGTVEFLSRGATTDRWLVNSRDMIVAKISGGGASLMLISMRAPDSPVLDINIQRLDADMFPGSLNQQQNHADDEATAVPAQILAHIHRVGDVAFNDGWAGSIGDRLWIEAFAIGSIGRLTPDLIEYCGLTADGYQTPWLGNQVLCGSRGRAIPMVGCAIRFKADIAERYDCTYTGQFVSGRVLGPFKNGDLCCSDLPRDPLWGIELSATQRVGPA